MPDGTIMEARYQGELPSSAALPPQGRFIGEEWSTGNTSWIWMTNSFVLKGLLEIDQDVVRICVTSDEKS